MIKHLFTCCLSFIIIAAHAQSKGDEILGKWESSDKNLIVQVYNAGDVYKAKVVWFYSLDTITSLEQQMDLQNPDKELRSRKIVGLDVLTGMEYNAKQGKYVNGKIYDSSSGKTYSATAWLSDENTMIVRGYYIVRMLGKTLNFKRVN